MNLILIRHGIAIEHNDPACPAEAERYLTKEGLDRTREAMAGLRALDVEPDAVLSSPYVRALQTAKIASEKLGFDAKRIEQTEILLPSGDPEALWRLLAKRGVETVACCGHAPNLDEVIAHAVGAESAFTALKKAGAACIAFDSPRAGRGRLQWLYPAATLRRLGA